MEKKKIFKDMYKREKEKIESFESTTFYYSSQQSCRLV